MMRHGDVSRFPFGLGTRERGAAAARLRGRVLTLRPNSLVTVMLRIDDGGMIAGAPGDAVAGGRRRNPRKINGPDGALESPVGRVYSCKKS
jgi:hypothetical protein